MRKIILLMIVIVAILSCKKDNCCNDGELSIKFISQSSNENYQFIVSNETDQPVWYWGYEEGFPIYVISVLTDTGWVNNGPGWCGTGLREIKFSPGGSFLMDVYNPEDSLSWRLGLHIFYDDSSEEEILWSEKVP